MNELFLHLGIERLKPFFTVVLLPPVPFLLLGFIGAVLVARKRRAGLAVVSTALVAIWLSGCLGLAHAVAPLLLDLPVPLDATRIAQLRGLDRTPVAVIVLGSGVEDWAPEYQGSSLSYSSLERLRYGVWLGRRIDWPTGFSGGIGWGQLGAAGSTAEATVAQRIASAEFGRPLKWVEAQSRDTRGNARNTVQLLRRDHIRHVLLVTHWWHMPRSVRNFQRAVGDSSIRIEAAPMGLARDTEPPALRWIPSNEGVALMRTVVREWLGRLNGA